MAEASQQDTVWRCVAVYGIGGFLFALPDTPHLLTKKNDPLFGSKGLALRAVIWHRMPELSRSGKEKSRSIRFDFFFPSLLFFFPKDRHVGLHFLREGQFIFAVTLLRDTLEFSLSAHFIRRCDLLFPHAIRLHDVRFLIVRELHIDHGLQTMAEIGVAHRDHEFDAVIEVSWHPVRTADIQLFTTAIGEPEDTAVLQEAADKASDSDVVTDAGDAGDEYADAADDELDPDACLRSFVELIYNLLIEEGIHLGDHVCLLSLLGEGDLAIGATMKESHSGGSE